MALQNNLLGQTPSWICKIIYQVNINSFLRRKCSFYWWEWKC